MKLIYALFIVIFSPLVWAASSVSLNEGKTVIEALSLEQQTIKLHGTSYLLSKKVIVVNHDGITVGLRSLQKGQWVEFKSHPFESNASYQGGDSDSAIITHIRILKGNASKLREE